MKGICANGLLCTVRIRLVASAWVFLVEARYNTERILQKKELNDYKSTYFEMYLFVILPFDSLLWAVGVCPASRVWFFKDILVGNRVSILVILVSNWVWF